jgi:hypothetical protein
MKQLVSSLEWDTRNTAAQDGELDSALAQRLDALEQKLLADHCCQKPYFYNDNLRYKSQFQLLLLEAAHLKLVVQKPRATAGAGVREGQQKRLRSSCCRS